MYGILTAYWEGITCALLVFILNKTENMTGIPLERGSFALEDCLFKAGPVLLSVVRKHLGKLKFCENKDQLKIVAYQSAYGKEIQISLWL